MKKVILALVVLIGIAALWFLVFKKDDDDPEVVERQTAGSSKYSAAFNQSVQKMLDAYYMMTEGFVNWDTATVNKSSIRMRAALDSIRLDEIKKDSAIYTKSLPFLDYSKAELAGLIMDPTLDEKRESLNLLSEHIYNFLRNIRYDNARVYYQECPMAFNDVNPGYWLSKTDAVRNPYLGTSHPRYKSGMLKCGGVKDSVNFIVTGQTDNK